MPAISIYKSITMYHAILLSSSAIALSTLYCKALPETRKKTSFFFFHYGMIKLLSTLFSFTNGPFRLKKSLRYVSRPANGVRDVAFSSPEPAILSDCDWDREFWSFSAPEAALLLVSTKNRDLWPAATTFRFRMAL